MTNKTQNLILKIGIFWAMFSQGLVMIIVMQPGDYVYKGDNLALTNAFVVGQTAFTCAGAVYVCRLWDKIQRGEI